MSNRFAAPLSFKDAVEARLKRGGLNGIALQRRRQALVFQRFLARLAAHFGDSVILKGGFALELRLERSRTTNDVDLVLRGTTEQLLERLQAAGQLELGDFMTFEVRVNKRAPTVTGDGVRYGGSRYQVECKLGGKIYGNPFGLDIVFGGHMLGEPARMLGKDVLDFAGVSAPVLPLVPIETHIAEKLHAFTLPRPTVNDRHRDLPDIALLATSREPLHAGRIREAIAKTFELRATPAVPAAVPPPPPSWREPYAALADEHELRWRTLAEVTEAVSRFLDPVLAGGEGGAWDRDAWRWAAVPGA